MYKLQIHNDGKERYQSFEARLIEYEYSDLSGYGGNLEESILELKKKVDEMIKNLKEIDWENFDMVDWKGEIIENK
jgi:hypothetical protein